VYNAIFRRYEKFPESFFDIIPSHSKTV